MSAPRWLRPFARTPAGSAWPGRLYVVLCDRMEPFADPAYETDPGRYGISLCGRLADRARERACRSRLKAFHCWSDVLRFTSGVDADTISVHVFDRLGGDWIRNGSESAVREAMAARSAWPA